jgi:hypothetical protein
MCELTLFFVKFYQCSQNKLKLVSANPNVFPNQNGVGTGFPDRQREKKLPSAEGKLIRPKEKTKESTE